MRLKNGRTLRTVSLNSIFTGSYKKSEVDFSGEIKLNAWNSFTALFVGHLLFIVYVYFSSVTFLRLSTNQETQIVSSCFWKLLNRYLKNWAGVANWCFEKCLEYESMSLEYDLIKEKLDFIEEMKTTWGNKELLKPCSNISFVRENQFNPFEFVPLATLRFEVLWHQKRMTLQNLLQNKQRNVRSSSVISSIVPYRDLTTRFWRSYSVGMYTLFVFAAFDT